MIFGGDDDGLAVFHKNLGKYRFPEKHGKIKSGGFFLTVDLSRLHVQKHGGGGFDLTFDEGAGDRLCILLLFHA